MVISHNPESGEWNDSLTGDFLWSNVNFGEAMPDVMTPFTWSVIQQGALGNWLKLQGLNSFGNICGRPYFNISIFATLLHLLGRNRQQILEMISGTLHLSLSEEVEIPLLPSSKRELFTQLPRLIGFQWRQMMDIKRLPTLLATNLDWCRQMRQHIQHTTKPEALISLWHESIRPHSIKAWSVYLSVTNHYANYATRLQQQLSALVGPDDTDALVSGLSSESELLDSLGPAVGLSEILKGEMTRQEYLERYGHRGSHEFEFSTPRPGEDPAWLERQLAEFEDSPVDVEALLAQQRDRFQAAWSRFEKRYPRRVKSMRRRIKQIAPRGRSREAIRSQFGLITWVFRAWALRAGELTGQDQDIFFLSLEEILALLEGRDLAAAFIPARQETYQKYEALPPYPPVIRGRFDPFQWAADPERRLDFFDSHTHAPLPAPANPNIISGAAGSAGRVKGFVRRIDDPEQGGLLQTGEILVTAQTNIGWTLIFPRAAAVVTDVGAPLSHAAIVARELGIPAVVGCGDATSRLSTGDRVFVDGGRGEVHILER